MLALALAPNRQSRLWLPGLAGVGGFTDIAAGAQVIGHDGSGAVIGTGALTVIKDAVRLVYPSGSTFPVVAGECRFTFEVSASDVPFYALAIGRRTSDMTYSSADLAAKGWTLDLTLGP